MNPQTIYICGPMTGYPYFNFPIFDWAQRILEGRGSKVISPAQMDREHGFDPIAEPYSVPSVGFLAEAMVRDLAAIDTVDAIALVCIDGVSKSRGCLHELRYAEERIGKGDMGLYYLDSEGEFDSVPPGLFDYWMWRARKLRV